MNPPKNYVVVSAQLWSNLLVQFGATGHSSAIRQRNLNVILSGAVFFCHIMLITQCAH